MRLSDARIIAYDAPGGVLYFAGWIAPILIGRSTPDWTSHTRMAVLVDNRHDYFGGNRNKTSATLERIRRRMGWCRAHSKLRLIVPPDAN